MKKNKADRKKRGIANNDDDAADRPNYGRVKRAKKSTTSRDDDNEEGSSHSEGDDDEAGSEEVLSDLALDDEELAEEAGAVDDNSQSNQVDDSHNSLAKTITIQDLPPLPQQSTPLFAGEEMQAWLFIFFTIFDSQCPLPGTSCLFS